MVRLCTILSLIIIVSCISATDSSKFQKAIIPTNNPENEQFRTIDVSNTLHHILTDPEYEDSLLNTFKVAYSHFQLKNYSTSLHLFRKIIDYNPELLPVAYIYIAEIEQTLGRTVNALAAYRTVLRRDIPQRFRRYIFKKIHSLITDDTTITMDQVPWVEEYFKWHPITETLSFDKTEDSLIFAIKQKRWNDADSMLANAKLSGKQKCTFISFADSIGDIYKLNIISQYTCAQFAHACGLYAFSESLYVRVKKHPDFSDSISLKQYSYNFAEFLYASHQWKQAIKEYKRYVSHYGNNAGVFISLARAYRKLKRYNAANVWYNRLLKHYPRHPKVEEILWLRAWQNEDKNNYSKAATYYHKIYSQRKKGKRFDESYLRHGLCYYRIGKYDSALTLLKLLKKRRPYSHFISAADYWCSKCYLAQNKRNDAVLELRHISNKKPFDYYAHRARQVLLTLQDTARITIDTTLSIETILSWLDSLTSESSNKKKLSHNDTMSLLFGSYLVLAGDFEQADFFIEPIELGFPGNLTLQYKLAKLFGRAHATSQSYRIARRLTWRIPRSSQSELPLEIYSLFYPPFYSSFISRESRNYALDPCLVSGIIRQESIFNPIIVSPAGAIGLMQIMPYTGKTLSKKIDVPFTVDSLYSPYYNLRFGIYYIHQLLEEFDSNPALALAAYNAGPHNATRWNKNNGKKEYDLFIEDIGFTETRGYVKKVLANYWTYQILSKYPSYQYGQTQSKKTFFSQATNG